MSELVLWSNGDGTFTYIPESQIPQMTQGDVQPTQKTQTFELVDFLFFGAIIILIIATWKEPIGYFALGLLIGWILIGVAD